MTNSTLESKKEALRTKMMGVKIKHARTRVGLSLKEVGQALDLSADVVSSIELGEHQVTLPQLEVMALIFNVPIMYFWSEDPIKKPNLDFPTGEAIALRQRIIGVLLNQARTRAGRSPEELANAMGVPARRVSEYELGQSEIPLAELEASTAFLNVPLSYFLDEGLPAQSQNGHTPSLDEIADLAQLPEEVRVFLTNPANLLYVNIAMKLSELSAETLRSLAEGLLEVTY